MGRPCSTRSRIEECIQNFRWKSEGKREDNIKMDLRERRWERELDVCGSGLGPVVNSCEHGNELCARNSLTS